MCHGNGEKKKEGEPRPNPEMKLCSTDLDFLFSYRACPITTGE